MAISTSIREGFGMVFIEPWLVETPVSGRNIASVTSDFSKIGLNFSTLYNSIEISYNKIYDFAQLNREDATQFILDVINSNDLKPLIKNLEKIKKVLDIPNKNDIIKNRDTILQNYSFENYGKTLNEIYKKLSR